MANTTTKAATTKATIKDRAGDTGRAGGAPAATSLADSGSVTTHDQPVGPFDLPDGCFESPSPASSPAKPRTISDASGPATGQRAVIYLRVSTPRQTETDYDPEGLSLPAQRRACLRKAEAMGLVVLPDGEYVEPGKSGTDMTHREEFQKMLKRVKERRDVDVVIVYKLARFARNRIDEALVMDQFRRRGVRLVSATEPIDASPEGQFMQGILSAMNQFRSQQDGAIIAFNLAEKAKKGGTIGRAPIGYQNVKVTVDGREISDVKVDEQRAPYVLQAFQLYADGATIASIAATLADRGLRTRPTKRYPAGPLGESQLHRLLRDPYYTGMVRHKDRFYPGRHEAIVPQALFDQVQEQLELRGVKGSRYRVHDHALKGLLYCGECHDKRGTDRRMVLQKADGHGGRYWYYFCSGHVDHSCDSPFVNVIRIEDAVMGYYQSLGLNPDFAAGLRQGLTTITAESSQLEAQTRRQVQSLLKDLDLREAKLVELAVDDALPKAVIHDKLAEVAVEREKANRQLNHISQDMRTGSEALAAAIGLLTDPASLLRRLSGDLNGEKLLHTAIFEKIYVYQDTITDTNLKPSVGLLKDFEQAHHQPKDPRSGPTSGPQGPDSPQAATTSPPRPSSRHTASGAATGPTKTAAQTGDHDEPAKPCKRRQRSVGLNKAHMAEGMGFEPMNALAGINGFQDRPVRPLRQPSQEPSKATRAPRQRRYQFGSRPGVTTRSPYSRAAEATSAL